MVNASNMVHWKVFSFLFIGYVLEAIAATSDGGGLADLAKILPHLAGGDNCDFRCPKGKLRPVSNAVLMSCRTKFII